jgi:phosphopantetheinyl transferase
VNRADVPSRASAPHVEGVTETGVHWRRGEWRAAEDPVGEPAPTTGPHEVRLAELRRRRRVGRRWVEDLVTTRLGVEWPGFAVVAPRRKPVLLGGSGIDVSISHSGGTLLVGVAAEGLVGVDVEDEPFEAFGRPSLVRRMCTEDERAFVSAQPDAMRRRTLARAWTVKEAVLKAQGVGLARDPREVEVGRDTLARVMRVRGPERAVVHVLDGDVVVRHP